MARQRLPLRLSPLLCALLLSACSNTFNPLEDYEQLTPSTILESPEPAAQSNYPADRVEKGKYLTGLLGCGSCHTNGALVGMPRQDQLLAGSSTGIAYSNPMQESNPGIVYPSNLTPDMETGIGSWSIIQIVNMVQAGIDNHGSRTLPVMPWPSYANINDEDANSIAMYLKSLPPVRHQVPQNVSPGRKAVAPFVHFGVYQSR
jgi:mono/diheme cytochrome c family protein